MFFTALSLIPFYLIGAFPSGVIIAKLKKVDISTQGSGNIGATNVARILGSKAGLVTLLMDLLKGFLAIWLANLLSGSNNFAVMAGTCAVFGHCFSLPPLLKGGKGVATSLGVFLYLSPITAIMAIIIFAITFASTKIVSLSSIIAAIAVPIVVMLTESAELVQLSAGIISLLVIYRHKNNIRRLADGTEKKFTNGK